MGSFYERGIADLGPFFQFHPWLYLFLVPAIGMRLWAEEWRSGTIELLLTLPLTAWQVVLGKFLAAWFFLGLALVLTFPAWLTVNYLGDPDNGVIFAGYIGSWLMAGGFLAIASCMSALTRNQVVAFILSVVVCFGFLLSGLPMVMNLFTAWAPQALMDAIANFSFLAHFAAISKGVIDLRDLVYFGLVMVLWLAATTIVLEIKKKSIYSIASLVLLLVLFVAVGMLSGKLFKGLRFDLTQNRLYTLSEGSRNILGKLREPVTIYLFFSQEASRDLPQIRSYATRVDELVEEFVNHSNGKLVFKRIDPAPFSEEEDQAAAFSLQAVPVGASGESLYLGLVGSNTLDDVQAMPFLQPSREQFLEYDLAKMISSLGNPRKKTIGLLSSLPMEAGYDAASQSVREAWVVYDQLAQLFEIQDIEPGTELPEDLDVLLLVHPKNLGEDMLYQVEQFVLGGGHLIAYLDPFAESDRGDPTDPMAQMQAGSASSLGSLLDAWGVSYDPVRVIGDLQYGVGTTRARHIGVLSVPAEGLDDEDIVSAGLEVVNFSSTGWFAPRDSAGTTFEPLVLSSENSAPMDSSRLRFLTNPAELMTGFNPTGERYALAARITGPMLASMPAPEGSSGGHVSESGESGINVLLFADTDMLTDRLWVQKQPFMGQDIVTAFADNGSMAVNAIDNMLGNRDLISIRTRASSSRPFERVEKIRIAAEKTYRATEERLQVELQETERKLTALQAVKGEGELTVISAEEQLEIQRFMDRKLEIRRELRQVQHDLQRDIDRLGTRLKLLNIGLMPVLVMIVALLYGARRRKRQNQPHIKEASAA
jgi:ABC-type uncharacterized transport system involved in gliding motility auxiliary subunit/ABC-type transport system involved in cytochrome c biogenesis permease component